MQVNITFSLDFETVNKALVRDQIVKLITALTEAGLVVPVSISGITIGENHLSIDAQFLPISILDLSDSIKSVLVRSIKSDNGVLTLGELCSLTIPQVKAIDGIGPTSLKKIRIALAEVGLTLLGDTNPTT